MQAAETLQIMISLQCLDHICVERKRCLRRTLYELENHATRSLCGMDSDGPCSNRTNSRFECAPIR